MSGYGGDRAHCCPLGPSVRQASAPSTVRVTFFKFAVTRWRSFSHLGSATPADFPCASHLELRHTWPSSSRSLQIILMLASLLAESVLTARNAAIHHLLPVFTVPPLMLVGEADGMHGFILDSLLRKLMMMELNLGSCLHIVQWLSETNL